MCLDKWFNARKTMICSSDNLTESRGTIEKNILIKLKKLNSNKRNKSPKRNQLNNPINLD